MRRRPNPTPNAARISGTTRKRSVETTARARSGTAPRPCRPRTIAIASAKTSTSASAVNISFRFTLNPAQTSGSASRAVPGLKKTSRTLWSACTPPLLQDRDGVEVEVEPLLLQLPDRPVVREPLDDRADLRGQLG